MYPSMRFSLLEDAVLYYTCGMSREVRDRAGVCLEMLQFGMDRTYLQFGDKYYHYEGAGVPDDPGLTIGGYESAWMADLGLAYLLEQIPSIVNRTEFLEFYRDDGLVIFDGNVTKEYVHNWVNRLQTKIDRVTGAEPGEHIVEFTAVMWDDAELDGTFVSDTVKVTRSDAFPYLDMQMFWSTNGDLHFKVHYKQHQRVIYLNNDSCHRRSTFNSIPNGVFIRLARLTTMTAANRGQRLDTLYPINAMALRNAGLAPKVFPTLEEAMVLVHRRDALDDADADSAQTTPETFVPGRDTFAKIGFSHFWSVPIHVKLAQLKQKYGLGWLRLKMAYHRFPNVNELFQADLSGKVMDGIESQDFDQSIPCNCLAAHKIRNGDCIYGGKCQCYCTVYKAICRHCEKCYIGSSQQQLKDRFQGGNGHFYVTKCQANRGHGETGPSSTLSSHLVEHMHIAHFPRRQGFTANNVRPNIFVDPLWIGDVIGCMKTFRTVECTLCMKERYYIFRCKMKLGDSVLNDSLDIHQGCRHNPKFHRFTRGQSD